MIVILFIQQNFCKKVRENLSYLTKKFGKQLLNNTYFYD